MITEIFAKPFSSPVTVHPGDTLKVNHTITGPDGIVVDSRNVVEHKADFTVTWTHSILFKLNGEQQWMVGTQNTVDWLKSQETK